MKPVFFINTSSSLDFENYESQINKDPVFLYNIGAFTSSDFNTKIKELYGLNPKISNSSTNVTIVITDDEQFASKDISDEVKIALSNNPGRISEIVFFHILKQGTTEYFNKFLKIREERRLVFSKNSVTIYDFCFSQDIYNSEETILELSYLNNGLVNLVKFISLNYEDFIRSLDADKKKIYSIGNANLNVPHDLLKQVALNQLELLIYYDFISEQFLNEKSVNELKENIRKKLSSENIKTELIDDFEFKNRHLVHGTKIHPIAYEIITNLLPSSEINTLLPNISSNYILDLYNRRNNGINSLFTFLNYANVREETLPDDLNEQFVTFKKTIDNTFEEFKNTDLLEVEESFIGREKEKEKSFKEVVNNQISEVLSLKKDEIRNQYGQTTAIEACIGIVDYIIKGKSDYVIKAETESFDLPHVERIISDLVSGGNSEQERHEKRVVEKESLENDLKHSVKTLQSNTKEILHKFSYAENIKSELFWGFKKRKENVKRLLNFTRLTKITVLTVFPILLLITLGVVFKNASFKYYLFSVLIPGLIGFLFIISLFWEYKRAKKKYTNSVETRKSLFIRYIRSYDRYITNTLEIVKEGYKHKLLINLKSFLSLKVYELIELRKHLIYQFSNNLRKIDSEIAQTENPFSISPVSIDSYFNQIIAENYNTAGNNLKPFLHIIFKKFVSNNKLSDNQYLEPQKFSVGIFEEIDPNEIVKPLPEHKDQYYKKLSDKEDDTVLYLKDKKQVAAVQIDDIKQGEIGNCYFMSAIGAIANCNPEFIENMIAENNHTYSIKFFNQDKLATFVTVDDKFWLNSGNIPIYANVGNQDGDKKEIWPMILEKAWAKINDGYPNIVGSANNNIKIDYGLALTGRFLEYKYIDENTEIDEIETIIINHFVKGNLPITLSSLDENAIKADPDPLLVKNHAYALKSYNPANKTVSIFNPHGNDHYLDVPLDFIKKNFDCLFLFSFKDPKWKFNIAPFDKMKISSKFQLRCPENENVYLNTEKFVENISFKTLNLSEEQLKNFALRIVNLSSPWISKNLINQLNFDNRISNPEQYVFVSDETNINEFDNGLNHNVTGNIQNYRIETEADFEVSNLLVMNISGGDDN